MRGPICRKQIGPLIVGFHCSCPGRRHSSVVSRRAVLNFALSRAASAVEEAIDRPEAGDKRSADQSTNYGISQGLL